ncbi:DUF5675 family protein [Amphritea sp. HPY]|uniref:DUF5675 family protein n=1 Tax=Amphritea sp. HPY TaxID=3421652 RepID=UPI003D7D82EE
MVRLLLERFAYMPSGVLGRLYMPFDKEPFLFTVERPWLGNAPNKSCIPEGVYSVEHYSSAKYPDHFEVKGVLERSYILFHSANYPSELQGCIAPGLALMPNKLGVQNSSVAMDLLREAVKGAEQIELQITHFTPEYP